MYSSSSDVTACDDASAHAEIVSIRGFVYRSSIVFADPSAPHLDPGGRYEGNMATLRECKKHYNYLPPDYYKSLEQKVANRQ